MASFISSSFQLTSNQTALALIVPEHLQSEINSLRKLHDKSYRKWQPHINIIYPFVDPSSLSSAVAILRKCLHNEELTSVHVNIDETGVFKHRRNATVFLKPRLESDENVCQLRRILVQALGCDEKDGTHDGIFRPHMTIGQAGLNGTAIEKLVEQAEKLTGLDWEGRCLAVLQRENSGEMRTVAELPLENLGAENEDGDKHLSLDTGWRPCYSFSSNTGWSQMPQNTDAAISEELSPENVMILTYNLMAEAFAPPFESRLKLIIEALSSATAQSTSSTKVLCLQEVNEEMLPLILAESFIQTNFPYSTHISSSLLPSHRNLVTLASRHFKNFHLEFSERHKEALIISFSEFPLEIANVHLTSALIDKAVEIKRNQMETLTNYLKHRNAAGKDVLVAGDFNITTSSHTLDTAVSKEFISLETAQLVGRVINTDFWEDAFDSTGMASADSVSDLFEGEEGATFDRLTNPLAAMSESPIDNRPQRYDRILFRKGGRLHPENSYIFGLPTEQGFCASDHYGVSVTLRINEPDQNTSKALSSCASLPGNIEVMEDSSNIQSLIEPYLPTIQDREHRQRALNLLHQTLTSNSNIEDLVFAPLGSYLMDTYSADSDVDLLTIGSVPAEVFFNFATTQLRALDTRGNGEFKGVHFVNSLVSIIEVSVIGIKFDLQYCQAPELLEKYHSTNPAPNLQTLVFDTALISSLSPSSIRPLNTYRDAAYLLTSLPDLPSYRIAHRFLSLYLKRRGLYSAKFGYLGGIHLSLMLNRVVKLIATNSNTKKSGIESDTKISPATIITIFFAYYASLDWANENVTDPILPDHSNVSRSTRDAIFIYSIHKPTARPNVASSCTRLTAQTLTQEFTLASQKVRVGDWQWCIRPIEANMLDFLNGFGAFIRVEVDVWDVDEVGGDKVREMISGLESKFPRLLVALGRVSGLDGRFWPARLRNKDGESSERDTENQFKGYYLAGVSCRDDNMDAQGKRLFTGKVITAVREFERSVKEAREMEGGNIWVSMEVVPKKKIMDMDLIVDEMDWGGVEEPHSTNSKIQVPDESYLKLELSAEGSNLQPRSHQRAHSSSLRPAQDIISRIHWDPELSVDAFVIGYEDRFVGVKEIELAKWKSEQTDDEFIPRHRIVWVRRKGEDGGEKVWDRRKKIDLIFGSGVGR